jgi:hypothetical protein
MVIGKMARWKDFHCFVHIQILNHQILKQEQCGAKHIPGF